MIFDHSEVTFRNKLYPEYKAHHPPASEDLAELQFALIRDATRAFGLPCIELDGYEADDLIAAYACAVRDEGGEAVIVSSDKDLMQLVTDRVSMFDPMKQLRIGPDQVAEKFGVQPDKVVDVQALCRRQRRQCAGLPGIGIKTASALITEYGDLDTLLARAGEIKQDKRRQTLIDFADQIRLSRQLVTLDCDTPMPEPIDQLGVRAARSEGPGRVPGGHGVPHPGPTGRRGGRPTRRRTARPSPPRTRASSRRSTPAAYVCVRDLADLGTPGSPRVCGGRHRRLRRRDRRPPAPPTRACAGFPLAGVPGRGLLHSARPRGCGGGLALERPPRGSSRSPMEAAIAALKSLFEDPTVLKVSHNAKYDMTVLAHHGVAVATIDDSMLASYVLDAGLHNHGLADLSKLWLDHEPIVLKSLTGSGKAQKQFRHIALEPATSYAAEDADITLRLLSEAATAAGGGEAAHRP